MEKWCRSKAFPKISGTDYRNKIANGYDTGTPIIEKNYNDLRTYDPKVTILAEGNHKTNIIYYDFLLNVINESSDINHDIAILNTLDISKFLIRCLGLSRVYYKQRIILTSIINWEEAFKAYIEKGWKIRYIPPIIMKDGMLQEASDDDQISILKEGKLLQKTNLGS